MFLSNIKERPTMVFNNKTGQLEIDNKKVFKLLKNY